MHMHDYACKILAWSGCGHILKVSRNRSSRKLNVRWIGPFKIIAKISSVAYKLRLPPNIKAHNVVHVSTLKRYLNRDDELNRPEAVIDDRYEAEYLIADRNRRGRKQYLVKWKGYADAESTWINEEDIDKGLIQGYLNGI